MANEIVNEEQEESIKVLDHIRQLYQNAQEEYGQELDNYEAEYGIEAREAYEEKYV